MLSLGRTFGNDYRDAHSSNCIDAAAAYLIVLAKVLAQWLVAECTRGRRALAWTSVRSVANTLGIMVVSLLLGPRLSA